ncbi:hypothetical protein Avbf_15880 [Armadillidium vulgare]|nr:hypothetical protein Avbf_15880 [Armadillidium vulgare]
MLIFKIMMKSLQ